VHDITHAGNGWQYISFTVPPNTSTPSSADWDYNSSTCQLILTFNLGTGPIYSTSTPDTWLNSNYVSSTTSTQVTSTLNHIYCVTGVQMEIGTVPTDYEHIPYNQELDSCQTYFQKSYSHAVDLGTNTNAGAFVFRTYETNPCYTIPFRKTLIRNPTVTITPSFVSGFGSTGRFYNGSTNVVGITNNIGTNSFVFGASSNAVVGAYNEFQWWAEAEPNII
jgi:hypothetical protein